MSIFKNDPFEILVTAFNNLYPESKYTAQWGEDLHAENGDKVWGFTNFPDDKSEAEIMIDCMLEVRDALEVFAHELAHVAVGEEHEHDDVWENAFSAIYDEYNRIMENVYGQL